MSTFNYYNWHTLSAWEKNSLTCCRGIRDAIARDLLFEVDGAEKGQQWVDAIVQAEYAKWGVRQIYDYIAEKTMRGIVNDQADLLRTISEHIAWLERQRVRQPILVPV